jgi:hypothetical protein
LTIGGPLSTKITLRRNIRLPQLNAQNVYPQDKGPYWCSNHPRQAIAPAHGKFGLK